MLLEKSAIIYQDLSTFNGLTSLLTKGSSSIRPLLATADDGQKIVTYQLEFEGNATKGSIRELTVIINSWANTYDETLAIADQVEAALAASTRFYKYVSAKAVVNEQNEIYTQQIFNIKN